ncbi:MAG: ATP synthase F1 subunit epsilon [Verrucomicrobiota bacterium]
MATINLTIVTPEGPIYEGEVDELYVPGVDGEIGVKPVHTALMEMIQPGELRIVVGGKEQYLAVGEGFAEILQAEVNVMTEGAIDAGEIDEAETQKAIERAQAALNDESLDDEAADEAKLMLARSIAMLNVKKKRRSGL